jgi:hypothetical protein
MFAVGDGRFDDHHQPWKVCQRSERGAEAPLYLI